jgi:hypothetical protein
LQLGVVFKSEPELFWLWTLSSIKLHFSLWSKW